METPPAENVAQKEESLDTPKPDLPALATKLDAIAQVLDERGYTADSEAISAVTEELLNAKNPA